MKRIRAKCLFPRPSGFVKDRLNWIDWTKAFCMTVVVFCHLPQQEDTFYLQYLASVILSSFFFVSGYLKKPAASTKEALKKYARSLLIPYIIYNAIYYPYWIAKHAIEQGELSTTELLKPIAGTLLGQLNSSFSCELNGVTWFLLALLLMHIVTDLCNRSRHGKAVMLALSLLSMLLYGANKQYHFAPYITFHGFVRCLCFFFMGNLFRQAGLLKRPRLSRDLAVGLPALLASIALFYWHIHEHRFGLHIALYYAVNLLSVYGIIYLSRCLDGLRLRIVTMVSLGTMLIFGLHRMLIGLTDFAIERSLGIQDVRYAWSECLLIAVAIVLVLVPLIGYAVGHAPALLGKSRIP